MSPAQLLCPTLALVFLGPTLPLAAQTPSRDSTAVAVGIQRLPVLYDDGTVIPESLIAERMRPVGGRVWRPAALGVLGMIVYTLASQPKGNAECDIYDPCTPREEWRAQFAPWVGLAVGIMAGVATRGNGRIDRWRAVEMLRAERRLQSAPEAR